VPVGLRASGLGADGSDMARGAGGWAKAILAR
jgi:hypothetical protein